MRLVEAIYDGPRAGSRVLEKIDFDVRSDAELESWRNRARYWRLPTLGALEPLRADFSTQRFRRHWHPGYAIGVVTRGAERFFCRGGHHVAEGAAIIAVNPGEIHDGESATSDGWRYRMIYPTEELMVSVARELWGERSSAPKLVRPVIADRELASAFLEAHRMGEDAASRLCAESGLLTFLAALLQRHSDVTGGQAPPPARETRRLQRTFDFIDANLASDLSLETLAATADINRFHLLRVFKRTVGLTPHAYVTARRVARGKTLLAQGLPAADAALAVGFYDQSHFANRFRQTYGMTPRAFQLGWGGASE
ncbi:MAG: AraC family transcriptional regulator [Candidatus Rokuibacteriota bacterium]